MIMESDIHEPINLGSNELVTINQLVDIAEEIAGIRLKRIYDLTAPKGVNGRNSDNTMIQNRLGWQPSIRLREGLAKTYQWIESEICGSKNRTDNFFPFPHDLQARSEMSPAR
jgi:nucleoside-diphosphate-sugar epimerase